MDDFKAMARLLAAIRASEEVGVSPAIVSMEAFGATERPNHEEAHPNG